MSLVVCGVMRKRSERECIFVDVLRLGEKRLNEVSASDIVNQVGEELAAERVVTNVLNNRSAISVSVRLAQLRGCGVRKSLQQDRLKRVVPRRIDDCFVCKHRITRDRRCDGCND